MRYLFLLWYLTSAQPDLPDLPDMMPCPDGWKQDIETTTCYKSFESSPKSWNAAESHCQSFGGDLASITSQREQELVVSILDRKGFRRTRTPTVHVNRGTSMSVVSELRVPSQKAYLRLLLDRLKRFTEDRILRMD